MNEMALILDLAIKIITLITIVVGVGVTLFRLGRMTEKFEQIGIRQASEITELKMGMSKVEGVLLALADQSGRLDRLDDRVGLQGQRIDSVTNRFNSLMDAGTFQKG